MKKRKTQPENITPHPPCEVAGCVYAGEYPAPKQQRNSARDYHFFCLEHVREFNKAYNFFTGMEDDAVQAFMKDAVTGHRPTWRLGSDHLLTEWDLEESVRRFFGDPTTHTEAPSSPLPQALRHALAVFSMTHPTDAVAVKKRYKQLVKTYHPDINKAPDAAEKFKEIIDCHHVLIEHYPSIR
jgi:hypothetical protein